MYIYLHGFNSSGASAKGRFFLQSLAPHVVHTPSYPPEPDAAIAYLRHTIDSLLTDARDAVAPILIGSSLGGFYAQYLARQFELAVVLINPALQPALTLKPYLGWQTNFYSGERYFFGENALAQLSRYDISDPCEDPRPTLVLLDAGDEIIDYRYAEQRYQSCAQVIVFAGGNHQFQHVDEAAAAIVQFRQKMRLSPQI